MPAHSLKTSFEAKVVTGSVPAHRPELGPCTLWTAASDRKGYGFVWVPQLKKIVRAHRVAVFLATGCWPVDCVLHECDNPACVRFDHLREGTQLENIEETAARKRYAVGERNGHAKLSNEHVQSIRSLAGSATRAALARQFGVTPSAVSRIVLGARRRDAERT